MRPLDFVQTPNGAIAIVVEKNYPSQDGMENQYSIEYLGGGNPTGERNAWWDESELTTVDNLASLLARNLCHPFGDGEKPALDQYPIK